MNSANCLKDYYTLSVCQGIPTVLFSQSQDPSLDSQAWDNTAAGWREDLSKAKPPGLYILNFSLKAVSIDVAQRSFLG